MLQDIPPPSLREASSTVLETRRLVLRQPTLADVKAIARLVNDRRIAENLRRVPHPYSTDDAVAFITSTARDGTDTVFLVEHAGTPVGMAGLEHRTEAEPELGYWFGTEHWGKGFATEAARAVIDAAFEDARVTRLISGARVINTASRNVLEKCGFQWTGVELHRFHALGCSSPVDRFRLDRSVWSSLKAWGNTKRR
ncbi:MAG: GNAT family N-acetyltransferase [Xanthobacteraceae bacterium]|nr:GNAT family N-acetyltransferase [Xanthobacteraceae bacterium]